MNSFQSLLIAVPALAMAAGCTAPAATDDDSQGSAIAGGTPDDSLGNSVVNVIAYRTSKATGKDVDAQACTGVMVAPLDSYLKASLAEAMSRDGAVAPDIRLALTPRPSP